MHFKATLIEKLFMDNYTLNVSVEHFNWALLMINTASISIFYAKNTIWENVHRTSIDNFTFYRVEGKQQCGVLQKTTTY